MEGYDDSGEDSPQDYDDESDRLKQRVTDLETQIERLRAALESLTQDPPATLDEPDPDWEVIVKMRAIARSSAAMSRQQKQKSPARTSRPAGPS